MLDAKAAKVNSFGFGGSNAFVVLDDTLNYLKSHGLLHHFKSSIQYMNYEPRILSPRLEIPDSVLKPSDSAIGTQTELSHTGLHCEKVRSETALRPRLLVWSAADQGSVKSMLLQYQSFFSQKQAVSELDLAQIAYTLSARRSVLAWRSYAVVTYKDICFLDRIYSKPAKPPRIPISPAFVFAGQGAQYLGMGAGLSVFPAFRESLDQSEEVLKGLGCEWSITREALILVV